MRFVIRGRLPNGKPCGPRTKKNSLGMRRRRSAAGRTFFAPTPSAAYKKWWNAVVTGAVAVSNRLRAEGWPVPIKMRVNLRVLVYRDRQGEHCGDAAGF